eukprot:129607-Prymnesium_polylepis.1
MGNPTLPHPTLPQEISFQSWLEPPPCSHEPICTLEGSPPPIFGHVADDGAIGRERRSISGRGVGSPRAKLGPLTTEVRPGVQN